MEPRGLQRRERPGPLEVHRRRQGDRPQFAVRGYTRVVEKQAVPLMLGARQPRPLRRRSAGPAAPLAAQAPRVQPGGARGAGRRQRAKSTCFGYSTSRAQDAGSGRALGRRDGGERFGRVQCQGPHPGQGSLNRRPVHHRRDDERVRREDPLAGPGWGGARPEPLQDVLAISFQLSAFSHRQGGFRPQDTGTSQNLIPKA